MRTIARKIDRLIRLAILGLCSFLLSLTAYACITSAHADTGSGSAASSGSNSASAGSAMVAPHFEAPPAPGPSSLPSVIHDPLEQPGAALDDARALKTHGWAAMAFGLLLMLTKVLAYASSSLQNAPVIGAVASWLSVGKRAVYVAGAGAIAAAAYNTLLSAGSLVAVGWAAALALVALMNPLTPQKA